MNLISQLICQSGAGASPDMQAGTIKDLSSTFHPGTKKGGHSISNAEAMTPFTRAVSLPLYQLWRKQVCNERGLSRGTEKRSRNKKRSEKLATLMALPCWAWLCPVLSMQLFSLVLGFLLLAQAGWNCFQVWKENKHCIL